MLRRLGALVAVALLAACGGDDDAVGETEAGVASVIAERLGVDRAGVVVTCPDDIDLEPGSSFGCDVAVGRGPGGTVALALTVSEDGTVELERAVIPTGAAEAYLATELAPTAEGPVEVDCGPARLIVRSVGESFDCTATRTADAVEFHVVVDVTSTDGSVHYRVEGTTTTATTATTGTTGTTAAPP